MVPLDYCNAMSTSRMVQHYRSQCNDSSSSCSSSSSTSSGTSSRRTIFPFSVHEKYTSLSLPPTPIIYSKKQSRQRCLSDHVTLTSKSLILSSTSSIESDMPSLMSSSTISDCTVSTTCTSQSITSKNNDDNNNTCCIIVGTAAQDVVRRRNVVRFDPRIIVHEYVRSKEDRMSLWLTVQELNSFKMNALRCIMMYNAASRGCDSNSNGITTWSSPISSSMSMNGRSSRVLFSHPALGVDNEYESDNTTSDQNYTPHLHRPIVPAAYQIKQFRDAVTENEIRNILIVDPLDTFLKLYTKGLRRIFPHCTIITANCTDDAIQQIQKLKSNKKSSGCFDIIIHDDLNEQAGSKLYIENTDGRTTKAIYINVCSSTHSTGITDRTNSSIIINEQHGTTSIIDFIWTKPPPLMNDTLRDILLKAILIKRSRIGIAKKLFF